MFKAMRATKYDTVEELVKRMQTWYDKHGQILYGIQPKLDGIRALTRVDGLYSRDGKNPDGTKHDGKRIPNELIQKKFKHLPAGLDGELYCHDLDFNQHQTAIMSHMGNELSEMIEYVDFSLLTTEKFNTVPTAEFIESKIDFYTELGYEGAMIRNLLMPYKEGESSKVDWQLVKLKRFIDAEAVCTGLVEEVDKHKTPKGTTGRLTLEFTDEKGRMIVFGCGSGLTDKQRQDFWDNPKSVIGQVINYKYQELSKAGVPRFPIFRGIRYD